MKFFPDLQASDGKSCNHRSRKRSISAARRLKTRLRLTMTKERFYAKPQGEDWANFWSKWSTRKSWCCCAWLHFFLSLTPSSFVKQLKKKKRSMSCNCIKKYWVNIRSTIFKVHNPTTPLPLNTLQKRWIGPRNLKTAPRALLPILNYTDRPFLGWLQFNAL